MGGEQNPLTTATHKPRRVRLIGVRLGRSNWVGWSTSRYTSGTYQIGVADEPAFYVPSELASLVSELASLVIETPDLLLLRNELGVALSIQGIDGGLHLPVPVGPGIRGSIPGSIKVRFRLRVSRYATFGRPGPLDD